MIERNSSAIKDLYPSADADFISASSRMEVYINELWD
jgi:hypothetical protein